jgi:hypothetical protein
MFPISVIQFGMTAWVVVPCPGFRQAELNHMLSRLDTSRVVVVTSDNDPVSPNTKATVLIEPWHGKIISEWWNAGLDWVAALHSSTSVWEVMLTTSDNVMVQHHVDKMARELRELGVSMVAPAWPGMQVGPVGHPRTVFNRCAGPLMMVAGEDGLRCDESFRWYYTEDDLEMQARALRGAALVRSGIVHLGPDSPLDAEQQRWADEDRVRFTEKWKIIPW